MAEFSLTGGEGLGLGAGPAVSLDFLRYPPEQMARLDAVRQGIQGMTPGQPGFREAALNYINTFTEIVGPEAFGAGIIKKVGGAGAKALGIAPTTALDKNLGTAKKALAAKESKKGLGVTLTTTPEFKAWFKNSPVVDTAGEPLVVYHRTGGAATMGEGVDALLPGGRPNVQNFPLSGTKTAARAGVEGLRSGPGIWMTDNPASSSIGHQRFRDMGEVTSRGGGEAIIPVHVSLQNPLIITSNKQRLKIKDQLPPYSDRLGVEDDLRRTDFPYRFDGRQRQQLEALGHDGIILRLPGEAQEIIAFEAAQIKSAFNRGTFSAADINMLRSGAAGIGIAGAVAAGVAAGVASEEGQI